MLAHALSLNTVRPLFALDPDAADRISQIETAKGSPMTDTQRGAIDTFLKQEKTSGRWSSHKRIIFPVWGNASANAIDLVTGAVGTWVNGPTHSDGYVQGNGTSQYFNFGTSYNAQGLTLGSAFLWVLSKTATATNNAVLIGAGSINPSDIYASNSATNTSCRWCGNSPRIDGAAVHSGIITFSRSSGNRSMWRRTTSGRSVLSSSVTGDAGTAVPSSNVFMMATNSSDAGSTPANYNNAQIGAAGFGLGLSDSDDAAFTSNLKTLWETVTGLTLP